MTAPAAEERSAEGRGSSRHPASNLSIGELAARTGLAPGTVRMWEARYGFPSPERLAGGHRRYSEHDAELVREVLRHRAAGLSLEAAIERARGTEAAAARSMFAGVRGRAGLWPQVLPKRVLVALSNAIEDEYCAHAERALLFAAFQTVRFYRQAEARWRELSRTAEAAVVFADFGAARSPNGGPAEVPLATDDPLAREWALVCDAPGYAACLAAWELPGQNEVPDRERRFETVWSVDRRVVRDAARAGAALASTAAPALGERLAATLEADPPPAGAGELAVLSELASRMVAYIARATG
jgi:MerR family transcriptional regulator, light-induced transcriptional regulator